jgi:hypothetical protein|tara:strand:- start:785 stop:1180 length:396 start_codon:yes stop_codon:yes gene_type:complete
MAHFAEIDESNIVTRVIVVADENEADGENWCNGFLGGTWKQTSYNTLGGIHLLGGTPFRKNYAGVGDTYDASRDAFIEQKQFASWTLNETTCLWDPPVAMPDDGKYYKWNETAYQADNSAGWSEVTPPTPT